VPIDTVEITHLASISSMVDGTNMITLEGKYLVPNSTPYVHAPPIDLFQILQQSHTPTWMFQHQENSLRKIAKPYLERFFRGRVVVVSDGSYKDDVGAAGVILENSMLDERIILTVPVPANKFLLENDSYRCEFIGVWFAYDSINGRHPKCSKHASNRWL